MQAGPSWNHLHQSTYNLLGRLIQGLEGQTGVGLFPDWCRVDAAGRLTPAPGKDTRFGWEAVRLPFRLALDGLWFGEPRAAAPPEGQIPAVFQGPVAGPRTAAGGL